MTPVGHQSEMTIAFTHLHTEPSGVKIMLPRRKSIAPEKMTLPSRKMTVIPDGHTKMLRGKNLTSKVDTGPQVGYFGV